MNYYKRHIGDYARDAGHLTALEHGIYTLLLDWYYVNEAPIPDARAHRIARASPDETQSVLDEFFQRDGDVWRHKRCDRDIEAYRLKAEANRANGKAGGRPRKTQSVSVGLPVATQPEPNHNLSHKPLTIKEHIPPLYIPPAETDDGEKSPAAPVPPVAAEPKAKKPKAQPSTPPRPDDVTEQTWTDWLALRRAKKAPVTPTVLTSARSEAAKAKLTLEKFLIEWCASGYHGLKADWLKPTDRGNGNGQNQQHRESAAERTARKADEYIRRLDAAEAIDGECARQPNRLQALDPDV